MSNKYIKFHGIKLADNSVIESLRIEQVAADPTPAAAGRLWYNTTEKVFKFSSLDGSDQVVVRQAVTLTEMTSAIAVETAARIADVNAEETARQNADAAIQSELDATQSGAGLAADGSLTAHSGTNYIDSATTLKGTDALLDAAIKAVADEVNTGQSGTGLNSDGSYTADGSSNYITTATTLKEADSLLDAQIKVNADAIASESTSRASADSANATSIGNVQSELDATQSGAGLGADGAYSANGATTYLTGATSLVSADEALDSAVAAVQSEVDASQTGAGLNTDGTYTADGSSNYITAATSLKDADSRLDAQIKSVADSVAGSITTGISGLQTEVDNVEAAVGLAADGTFDAFSGTNYLDSTTSIKGAAEALDTRAKANADAVAQEVSDRQAAVTAEANSRSTADSNLQSELDATQVGAGLGADGSYTADGSADYISGATSLSNADSLLDDQIKANADAVAQEVTDRTNAVAAEASARSTADSNLQSEIDATQTGAGLAADGSMTAHSGSNYIDGAGNLKAADAALDAAIAAVSVVADAAVEKAGDTMAGTLNMSNNRITNLPSPVDDADAATKAYVDANSQGLDVKSSVRVATTGNVDLSSALANGSTVDGVTLSSGDRILVKNQTDASENGIYVAQASGAAVRATDFDSDPEVTSGAFTFVEEGTANGSNGYVLVTPEAITVGSTDMSFEQFSGAGQIEAGAGIKKNGNELFLSFGAGVVELPSDEIGLDLASDSGMMLSTDGSNPSTDTAATLQLKLDGATLTKTASGVRVASSVITDISNLQSDATSVQSELDATQTGAGLNADGSYTADGTADYISGASSLKNADSLLATQVKTNADAVAQEVSDRISAVTAEASARSTADSNLQSELDATQSGAGLGTDGSYSADGSADYISAATSLANADSLLDDQIKANADAIAQEVSDRTAAVSSEASARSTADSNLQSELDATQAGAGLGTDGSYTANGSTNYLTTVTTLVEADEALDAQIKSVADSVAGSITTGISGLQAEVDATQTAAGLAADGSFDAHSGSNYIDSATTMKEVDAALDAQIAASHSELDSLISDVEGDLATETAARISGDSAIRSAVNSTKFTFQSTSTATTHTISHNLNSNFLVVQVMVLGDDGLYANDLVPVEETDANTLTCYLTESRHVRVSVMSMSDI